ncbi:chitinase domain-containing protein 1-like [Watersipora subatra]|uniref:chitinase domain-containing protein 1-like n=1 Tax=Watersipora subatra TaxID=2589382 RepID=UPI00355AEA66
MRFIVILTTFALLYVCQGTLSRSDKKEKKPKKKEKIEKVTEEVTVSPNDQTNVTANVKARGLVQSEVTAADIVKEHSVHSAAIETREFSGPVLAYVTPWNSKGYDIAKKFHKKFTLVSPVWLQVSPKGSSEFVMNGGHDIDRGWVKEVLRGKDNSIVPRVLFDKWSIPDYQKMFSSEANMGKCAKTITSFIKKHGFGGVTIEIWSQMPAMIQSDAIHFLIDLASMLHQAKKIIVLVVPPLQISSDANSPSFTREHFDQLKDSIDYFSLMTYDYHSQSRMAGPISPISWVEQSVTTLSPYPNTKERGQLLLGLNFYGIKFGEKSGAQPVIGHEFIYILKHDKPQVTWQPKESEHAFIFRDHKIDENAYLFYPSLLSLQERIKLASTLGTGISIWEIGQGLDYFYDLL